MEDKLLTDIMKTLIDKYKKVDDKEKYIIDEIAYDVFKHYLGNEHEDYLKKQYDERKIE